MTERKKTPQDRYQARAMDTIIGKYKKEFVAEFKEACKTLGITQSEVIRAAMEETIKKASQ